MRTPDQIFKYVLDQTISGHALMIKRLFDHYRIKNITAEEFMATANELADYIGGYPSMQYALHVNDLSYSDTVIHTIYSDWNNRPPIVKGRTTEHFMNTGSTKDNTRA